MTDFLNKYKSVLIGIGVLLAIVAGGKDTHFWGLYKPSVEQILSNIASGKIDPRSIVLDSLELIKAKNLIAINPDAYSENQKYIVKEKSGNEILLEVGLGFKQPQQLQLTQQQLAEIKSLILAKPQKYTALQKSLIPEFTADYVFENAPIINPVELNMTAEEILYEVGVGNYDPEEIKLTENQREQIIKIINHQPDEYNDIQKSLVK